MGIIKTFEIIHEYKLMPGDTLKDQKGRSWEVLEQV